jgi:hypothetical protein
MLPIEESGEMIWHERTHRDPGATMFRALSVAPRLVLRLD